MKEKSNVINPVLIGGILVARIPQLGAFFSCFLPFFTSYALLFRFEY